MSTERCPTCGGAVTRWFLAQPVRLRRAFLKSLGPDYEDLLLTNAVPDAERLAGMLSVALTWDERHPEIVDFDATAIKLRLALAAPTGEER